MCREKQSRASRISVSSDHGPRSLKGFTLIELLVVIAIIALLMAILMPALMRVKKQAKAVICQTNLRQWGTFFSIYMEDHNNQFGYGDSSGQWRYILQDSPRERKLNVCCPEAANPNKTSGTYGVWGGEALDADYVMQVDYGSYGLNRWVYNRKDDQDDEGYWKGNNFRNTNQIPLFQDCSWYGAGPLHYDNPPEYEGHTASGTGNWRDNNMRRVCMNRHNAATNIIFLDISVRRIGLKELWTPKWNTNYIVNGPWTKAGGVVPGDWPQWMNSFRDY